MRRRLSVALAAALLTAGLHAAPAEQQPPVRKSVENASGGVSRGGRESSAQGEPTNSGQPPSAAHEQEAEAQSPDVFRPSEKISEDLSVSYPVDI